MFFYLSKIFYMLLQPSNLLTLVMTVGGVLIWSGRYTVWARRLLKIGVGSLLVLAVAPVGVMALLPLEERFPPPQVPSTAAGIIFLGGFESSSMSNARGHLALNKSGERLTEAVLLANKLPMAKVIFTGGVARLVGEGPSAASSVESYLTGVGIAPERIVVEGRSRTTYENALNLREMLHPAPGQRYVLVTSASHMPRAVGCFRQQGFDVLPWPVDYWTTGPEDLTYFFGGFAGGLDMLDIAFREWIGLVAYRLSGRTNALWPGPV